MFYSQFILAKKGPLGTIWIAAHLERRLRRNQVNETNITTSVDSILFPEVPIALRLSGQLLLGVVRIYSRKVTYLFEDCNEALHKLKTAFTTGQKNPAIDLPPDVAVAPAHSITLPEEFFEFENLEPAVNFVEDTFDHHVTSRDKITLDEPVVEEEDLGFRFPREENFASSSYGMDVDDQGFPSSSNAAPQLQEDVLPPMDLDAGLVEETEAFPSVEKLRSAPEIPEDNEVEKLRSAPEVPEDDFSREKQQDTNQPELEVEAEPVLQADLPVPEDNHLVEDEQPIPSTPSTRPEVASPDGVSPDATPALAVVDTPASEKKRGRKRREFIDEQQTLSESYMKNMLNDPSDIRRVRRKVANTPQLIRMVEKEVLGKRIFNKPSAVQGLCAGLAELYEEVYNPNPKRQKTSAAATVNVTFVPPDEQATVSPSRVQAPASPVPVPGTPPAMKTPASPERANNQTEGYTPFTPMPDFGTPANVADATPAEQNLDARAETGEPTSAETTQNVEIPLPELEVVPEVEVIVPEGVVSEVVIPEVVVPDAEVEAGARGPAIESSFLGESTSEGSETAEGWSSRTRAIAQFLHTTFEQGSTKVSVNGLLRNKTRKEAARMFFETLVLTSNDYISVEQSKPYEDVTLHARPKLVKAVF